MLAKVRRVLLYECADLFRAHRLGALLAALLPSSTFNYTRVYVLRLFGWNVEPGALFASTPQLLGSGRLLDRLTVGHGVFVNVGGIWDLGGAITIRDHVHLGPNVSLLTTTHEVGDKERRGGTLASRPITIGDGAWIGAGAIVLQGCTIGAGSIVAAGCVVRSDVPANCLFGGVPGRVLRRLDHNGDRSADREEPEGELL